MYKGTNPAALRSKESIIRAFKELLKERHYKDISIKDIMEATNLSRQTFYQIFNSKDEILSLYFDELMEDYLKTIGSNQVNNLCDIAKIYFSFFDTYKDFIKIFMESEKCCLLQSKCREFLMKEKYFKYTQKGINNRNEKYYAMTFVINGIVGMMGQNIRNNKENDLTSEEMADLVCRITNN